MSHIVTIKTEVRDPGAIQAACQRLKLPPSLFGPARLYSESATGWQVKLPDWRYPVVFDTARAQVNFDNFNGRWGEQSRLDTFLQIYAVEKAKLEARRQGHSVSEQQLADGTIKVQIMVAN